MGGGRDRKTTMSIKRPVENNQFGGDGYGGAVTSGYVTHEREVEIGTDGVVRFPGVAATLDAATVEFASATDPTGTHVVEQRLVNDLVNPEALLFRQIGKPVVVTFAGGEISGTLRALSTDALVIETADRATQIVPRGPHVYGIKLAAAAVDQEPTLEWRVTTARPGKHQVNVSYRADALSWQPEYSAILGDKNTIDVSAWAAVRNETGTDFVDADVTLSAGGGDGTFAAMGLAPGRPATSRPQTWKVPGRVTVRSGQPMQVELVPRKVGAKYKTALMYEAIDESAVEGTTSPVMDCSYIPTAHRIGEYLEVDLGAPLPNGPVRLLRRVGNELVVVGTDQLRGSTNSGVVRINVTGNDGVPITGERTQINAQCTVSPSGRSLTEELELTITNSGDAAVDVVIREYMFRWHRWKIVRESVKGTKADDRAQEYRVKVPAGDSRAVQLTVQYDW
jgi:hypothetical protein